jgi:hypothetical protein
MALTDQIIGVESGGDPNARNPNSSAMGAGQFISSTWLDMVGRYRPDLVQGKSPEEILALRSDPQLSREMTEAYAAQNGRTLTQAGHEATPGNTYLAHFAGPKGAVSVLSADPNTPVSAILTPEAIKANPFLARMTAADLRAWADKKMGGAAPVQQPPQASPAAPANGLLAQPSGGLAPPSAGGLLQAPIFPQAAPQQQPQAQPQQAEQSMFDQMQPPQAAPIVFPKQRQVDLSKLRAALQRPPIFSQRG